jgi:hypothetical protein
LVLPNAGRFAKSSDRPELNRPLPAGLEPATLGSEDRRHDRATSKDGAELRDNEPGEVPTVVPSPPGAVSCPEFPPDLALVGAAWDRLPDAIKAGVLALVQAAGGSDA